MRRLMALLLFLLCVSPPVAWADDPLLPNGLDDRWKESYDIIGPNEPPSISALTPNKSSPLEAGTFVTWTAETEDQDNDPICV